MANTQRLKLDLGCGSCKKPGTIGLDYTTQPGVDYVLDLGADSMPFPDRSVDYIYSSHFLEHLTEDTWVKHLFPEISRVCISGARLEFWTPYNWSNSAFILGHRNFINEDDYLHLCVMHPGVWETTLGARWLLKEICYVVLPHTLVDLHRHGIALDFALRYFKEVVQEMGVVIEVQHNYQGPAVKPQRTFAVSRDSTHFAIKSDLAPVVDEDISTAIRYFQA